MTRANDSVIVTPGSGTTMATHTIASKEHEVFMGADAAGNLLADQLGVYASTALNLGTSNSETNRLSLLNADAALIVDVLGVWAKWMNDGDVLLAISIQSRLRRCTAHSGGTLLTPVKLDSTTGALDGDITVRSTPTSVTQSGEDYGALALPTSGGNASAIATGAINGKLWLWDWRRVGAPIVCRQNEGVVVRDITNDVDINSFPSYGIIFRVR